MEESPPPSPEREPEPEPEFADDLGEPVAVVDETAADYQPRKPPQTQVKHIGIAKVARNDPISQSVPSFQTSKREDKPALGGRQKAAEAEQPAPASVAPPPLTKPRNRSPLHCQIYLKSIDDVFFLHAYEIEGPVLLSILTSGDAPNEEEQEALWVVRKELKKELQSLLGYMTALDSTHLEAVKLTFVHQLPGLVHFMYVDRNNDRLFAPKITGLVGHNYRSENLKEYNLTCKEYLRQQVRFCQVTWNQIVVSDDPLVDLGVGLSFTKLPHQWLPYNATQLW